MQAGCSVCKKMILLLQVGSQGRTTTARHDLTTQISTPAIWCRTLTPSSKSRGEEMTVLCDIACLLSRSRAFPSLFLSLLDPCTGESSLEERCPQSQCLMALFALSQSLPLFFLFHRRSRISLSENLAFRGIGLAFSLVCSACMRHRSSP